VGRNNFGHPSGETLAALAMAGIRVLRTDLSGDVSVGLAANGATEIREEHPARTAA
jgi:beta-lactamase superfamily II metal-dependent hydrolase